MMTLQEILGAIAVLIGVAGYAYYIRGIMLGNVKPHAFTWLIWGILTAVAFVAQVADGGGAGAWVTGVTALFCFAFVIVGLTKSSRRYIKKSDWIFFAAALGAIPLWYISGSPFWSVAIITLTDIVATIPTIRKAYQNPNTESATLYALSGVKFILSVAALQSLNATTALYPVSLILINILLVIIIIWRRNITVQHQLRT
jgi:hypothetical protein